MTAQTLSVQNEESSTRLDEQQNKSSFIKTVPTLLACINSTPTNIMLADRDFNIQFLNSASIKTLKTIEHNLPVRVDEIIGQSIDIFHKNPQHQRRLLSNPRNLPHESQITIGEDTLYLLASAIYDDDSNYIGPIVTWEVITKRLESEERAKELEELEQKRTKDLNEKVDNLLEVVQTAADGDLTKQVNVFGSDPAGQLGEGLSKFIINLRSQIAGIGASAGKVDEYSNKVKDISQQMSATAEETSTQAGVVSSASEEVNNSIQTVATGAEEMSASIREIAQNSTQAANITIKAVKVAEDTTTQISKLGESSKEIGEVLKVITAIAGQTNLLALNATIEAARAGEAGKGFAVVATEVKQLANQTASATEDIRERIKSIQTDTQTAVSSISEISEVINQINDISATIASAVEEQSATTDEIVRSITDASKGSNEITINITGVAQAAQDTAQGSKETQESSEELSHMAEEMKNMVGYFKYRDESMTLMAWNQAFSVNIEEIDNQHKRLIALINQVYQGMMQEQSREEMGLTLDALVEYTVNHFGYEERLFEKHGYPETESHLAKHKKLVSQVSDFHAKFKSGEANIDLELLHFLQDWLKGHIMGTDQEYVEFLNGKGVV